MLIQAGFSFLLFYVERLSGYSTRVYLLFAYLHVQMAAPESLSIFTSPAAAVPVLPSLGRKYSLFYSSISYF